MDFARNPIEPETAAKRLSAFGAEPAMPLWLLVDAALIDSRRFSALASSLNWRVSNALTGSSLEVFGTQGPQLVELPRNFSEADNGLRRLLATAPTAPAFSLFSSPSPTADLYRLFGYLAQARVDGDLLVHCRFADSRVLPHLLHNLSPTQRARVETGIDTWAWLDNLGAVNTWQADATSKPHVTPDTAPHLELNKLQFATLLDTSEPDTLFSLLLDNTPELVPARDRGQFRNHLTQILARANARHLATPNDRLQFAVLSLSCGDGFHEHPDLQSTWLAIEKQGQTLVEQMKQWSDGLWEQLQARGTVR